MDIVERTWEEIGCKIKPVGYRMWVRTKPHVRKTEGGLWLPPKLQKFHGELPHLVTVHATVLCSGPKGVAKEFKPGDVVAFKRLHFGFQWKLEPSPEHQDVWGWDEEYVGFIDANEILWKVIEDEEDRQEGDGDPYSVADAAE